MKATVKSLDPRLKMSGMTGGREVGDDGRGVEDDGMGIKDDGREREKYGGAQRASVQPSVGTSPTLNRVPVALA